MWAAVGSNHGPPVGQTGALATELAVLQVPIFDSGSLPLGVQVIGPAYREEWVLRVAQQLQQSGLACAHPPVIENAV